MISNELPAIDYNLIQQIRLFKDLPNEALQDICREAQAKRIEKDGFFFLQGDLAERQYLLLTGRLKLTQTNADGQSMLLRAIGPYSLFGLVVLAQVELYPVSAEALEDCTALGWTKPTLMQFVTRYPAFALNAIQAMASHTQEFQERLRQMGTERVEQRLAHTLLRLASQTGKKTPEGVLIDLPLTRQDLGEMTGTTLYTVSRLLSQWESQGLIIADREHIVIRYPHGLVSIAES
jgi:CRP/FNR family transcriptional regulator, nitrogen oxide reductase regulator